MGFNSNVIKKRILDGLDGKSPVDGKRITVADFSKDFTDKSKDGFDEFAHNVQKANEISQSRAAQDKDENINEGPEQ